MAATRTSAQESEDPPVRSKGEKQDRYIVPGLVRGLAILTAFSNEDQELGVSDIARKIGTTRSTAFRLAYTLEHLGYLQKAGNSKRYRIASRVLDLGYSYLSSLDIVQRSGPILEELRDHTNTSTHLIVRDGREIVYVARCESRMFFASTISVGTRLPAHATAPGRVLLSGMKTSDVVSLYDGVKLERFSDQTPTSTSELISQLERDRENGHVISWGFFDPKVTSIAAPIRDETGTIIAAISVSCPMSTYERDEFETKVLRLVQRSADDMSQAMGYWGER